MKTFSLLTAVLALGFTLVTADAEAAKRFGGGKSFGMQRQATPPAKSPSAAPAPAKTQQAAGAPQTPQKRSWMGPIAGLAAGLGLAALASHLGFGEELASMLMIGLLVVAVMFVIGFIMRRRAATQHASANNTGMQYASAGTNGAAGNQSGYEIAMPGSSGSNSTAESEATQSALFGHIPADFEVSAFERNAKVSFIRLQAANDVGDLDDIRAFTTPEMYAEISMNLAERGDVAQSTEVLEINAEVIDVSEEATRYVVSVRFTGLIKEDAGAAAESINEIWHMVKAMKGKTGWMLAGIQQAT